MGFRASLRPQLFGWLVTCVLLILYVKERRTSSHHVQLALYAGETAVIATSLPATVARHLLGVISHRPIAMAGRMEDSHQRLEEHRDALL